MSQPADGGQDLSPLFSYLAEHKVMHLSTRGPEGVHSTPLFFAYPEDGTPEIFWQSTPTTLHSRHLEEEPRAGLSVSTSRPPLGILRGIQLRGPVRAPEERQEAMREVYLARFPEARLLVLASTTLRFYSLRIEWARLIRFDMGLKRNIEWELSVPPA